MRPYTITLADQTETKIPARGRTIFIQSSTASLFVTARSVEISQGDGGIDITVAMLQRQKLITPRDFDQVVVRNESGASVNAVILAGFGDFDAPLSEVSLDGGNTLVTTADATAGAAAASILAANADRKRVHLTAHSANTQNVRVGDSNITATRGQQLQPGMGMTFNTTAEIFAIREAAGTVDITIVEET
jgi:hypothetical protein